ncbi:conserved membrane protein of unknown function [Burkholderia multivorans]
MTRAIWMKFAAGVLLFGTWLGLVLAHLAPAPALIDAIGYTLVGLGIYHAAAGGEQVVLKFASGALLFGAWLALVVVHLAPAAGLVDALGYALMSLGIYQAKNVAALPAFVTSLIGGTPAAAAADDAARAAAAAGSSTVSDPAPADQPAAVVLPAAMPVDGAAATPPATPAPIVAPTPAAVQ